MQEWDGLASSTSAHRSSSSTRGGQVAGANDSGMASLPAPVMILGATNRPADIDRAFLRRMPLVIELPLPDAAGERLLTAAVVHISY